MTDENDDPMTEEELLYIFRRSKQYPKGRYRVTLIDKDYVPAGSKDLNDPHHKAFAKLINEFLANHDVITVDDIPPDFLLRSALLGLKSQSTSLRSKSMDYLMQIQKMGKYELPPEEPDQGDDLAEPTEEEKAAQQILDELL